MYAHSVRIAARSADIIELGAYRGQTSTLAALAHSRATPLPALGHVERFASGMVLAVRPERWLLLARPAEAGALARSWREPCGGCAAVIEQSAALAIFHLSGDATREVLKRGCRLDLDESRFPAGTAAATFMAQVTVVLAALEDGMLLLVPSSTSRHFHEWLNAAARPFGPQSLASAAVAPLSGESIA